MNQFEKYSFIFIIKIRVKFISNLLIFIILSYEEITCFAFLSIFYPMIIFSAMYFHEFLLNLISETSKNSFNYPICQIWYYLLIFFRINLFLLICSTLFLFFQIWFNLPFVKIWITITIFLIISCWSLSDDLFNF